MSNLSSGGQAERLFEPGLWSRVQEVPEGRYAMWWPTDDDQSFRRSEARELIGRCYRAAEGIETYIFADL